MTEEEFGNELDSLRPRLHKFALKRGVPADEVDDIVEDAILEAWKARAKFEGRNGAELATWVIGILKHVIIDWRSGKRDARLEDKQLRCSVRPDRARAGHDMELGEAPVDDAVEDADEEEGEVETDIEGMYEGDEDDRECKRKERRRMAVEGSGVVPHQRCPIPGLTPPGPDPVEQKDREKRELVSELESAMVSYTARISPGVASRFIWTLLDWLRRV